MINILLKLRQRIGDWQNGLDKVKRINSFKGPLTEKQSVLILTDLLDSDNVRYVNQIRKEFKELCPSATVTLLVYYDKKVGQDNYISDKEKEYFTEDDFGAFFKIKNSNLLSYLKRQYDIAFLYSPSEPVCVSYLSQYVTASLRIGIQGSSIEKKGNLNFLVGKHGEKYPSVIMATVEGLKMMFGK